MTAVVPIAEPSALAPEDKARIIAECRERVRLEDIVRAKDALYVLYPAPHHATAALALLAIDDDESVNRHLSAFFSEARAAHSAWQALKRLQDASNKNEAA